MQNDYDLNGNGLTAVLDTAPATGSLEFNTDGSFVYTPSLNFNGPVTFSYQLAAAENLALMAGYWTMDDNALTATDSSGHGRTTWLLDGNMYITDPAGHWTTDTAATSYPNPYAVMFDGINDWGVIASQPAFNFGPDDDFAAAFWLKADTTQADADTLDNMLVSKYASVDNSSVFAITLLNQTSGVRDGRILVSRSDVANIPFIESTATVNDNQYHHIAFVKNGDVLSLYIDGILEGTATDTTATPTHAIVSHIYLGKLENNTRYFQGALDDLRIYGRGLSAAEVAQLAMGNNAPQFSQTAVVTINVTSVNETPIAADDSYTTTEDTPLNAAVPGVLGNDTDGDGDSLTAVLDSNVTTGTLSLNSNGSFTYIPPANWSGITTFSYYAYDGQANSNTAVVTLTVTAVNDAPIVVNDAYTTTEDMPLSIAAPGVLGNDSDVEGDAITAVLDTDVTNGTLSLNSDGSFSYTPDADFCGTDSFTYYANDGQDDSSVATVTFTITCVNDAPIANDDTAATDEDTAINITVLDNDVDVDGDSLTVTAISTPATGSTSTDGTTVTYTPVNLVVGYTAVFTYTISDGSLSATATITVTIAADNDAPTAVDDMVSVMEDSSDNMLTIMDNDSDPDGDDFITLMAVGTPDQGGTAVLSGNTILYTPAPDFVGTETFTYTIHDMGGLTDTAVVTVDVDNENDAPTAVDDSYTVDENSSDNIFTVLDNDSDIDVGDSLSISEVSSPVNGTAVISGTAILYTPAPDFFGTDTFTYTITDGALTDTATVTVSVTPMQAGFTIYLPVIIKP
ncbi:MAG TPA: Ig-like domain-containing protein [Chloroflexota bacterium]|nr:Ig-like domain-containing protein [Chloroflexota bacterium]